MASNERKMRIFSALEVANICGVVNQTAINWIRSGHLRAFTTPGGQYRVYAEDLSIFLDKRGMKVPYEVMHILKSEVEWNLVLIIDSDKEQNNLLKQWIEKKLLRYKTVQAFNGFEAGIEMIRRRPGFILLNVTMPGIGGHSLCRRIKEDPKMGGPFIIVTGIDKPLDGNKLPSGFYDAVLFKPVNYNSLASIIYRLEKKPDSTAKS